METPRFELLCDSKDPEVQQFANKFLQKFDTECSEFEIS